MEHEYKRLRIAEFCATGSGTTPSRNEIERYYDGGTIPWVKSGELRESVINKSEEHVTESALRETSLKLVPEGPLLLAMYGATVGRLGILGVSATTNQAVCHIVPDANIAFVRFLFYALSDQVKSIIARGVGGAQPNINQGIVQNLVVRLPSLPEQRRIAEVLDRAEALRAKRRAALVQLDSLTQAIFIEMFGERNIAEQTIGEMLEKGILCMHKDGNHGSLYPRADDFGDEGVPFISAQAIDDDGEIDESKVDKLKYEKAKKLRIGWVQGGDVLLAHNASVGKVALYDGRFPEALIGTSLTAFRPDAKVLTSEYLAAALRSMRFQNQLQKNMGQTTRNQVPITAQRRLSIPIPPYSRQKQFATRIAAVGKLKATHRASLAQLNALFASLQHRAFRRELYVTRQAVWVAGRFPPHGLGYF